MFQISYLIGTGWWILWYAVFYISLLPLIFFLNWSVRQSPGTGANGGEVMVLLGIFGVLTTFAVSVVNFVLLHFAKPVALGNIALHVLLFLFLTIVFSWILMTGPDKQTMLLRLIPSLFILMSIVGFNLFALHSFIYR